MLTGALVGECMGKVVGFQRASQSLLDASETQHPSSTDLLPDAIGQHVPRLADRDDVDVTVGTREFGVHLLVDA